MFNSYFPSGGVGYPTRIPPEGELFMKNLPTNLWKLSELAISHNRIISWAFNAFKDKTNFFGKPSNNWYYPLIQTMMGGKGYWRTSDNGYCHMMIWGNTVINPDGSKPDLYYKNRYFIRLSRNCTDLIKQNKDGTLYASKEKVCAIYKSDAISDKWENFDSLVFLFTKNGIKGITVIDWNKNKDFVRNQILKDDSSSKYVEILSESVNTYYETDVPIDYRPVCAYEKYGFNCITQRVCGVNTKKVTVQQDGKIITEYNSVKSLFDYLKHYYNCKNYASLKSIISQNKRIYKKDKSAYLEFQKTPVGLLIMVNLCNHIYNIGEDKENKEITLHNMITKVNHLETDNCGGSDDPPKPEDTSFIKTPELLAA